VVGITVHITMVSQERNWINDTHTIP